MIKVTKEYTPPEEIMTPGKLRNPSAATGLDHFYENSIRSYIYSMCHNKDVVISDTSEAKRK